MPPLQEQMQYYIRARYRSHRCKPSPWSSPIGFRTGSLTLSYREVAKTVAHDQDGFEGFGQALAISHDARWMFVGVTNDPDLKNQGSIYVYQFVQDRWVFDTKIKSEIGFNGQGFAISLSTNADGSILLVGVERQDKKDISTGAVHYYRKINGVWTLLQNFKAVDVEANDHFGKTISMNAAGTQALIAKANRKEGFVKTAGAVYVYTRSGDVWQRRSSLVGSDANTTFGSGVYLTPDASRAVINDLGGTVRFYTLSNYLLTPTGESFTDERAQDTHSSRLAMDASEEFLFISQSIPTSHELFAGRVHVYRKRDGVWQYQFPIRPLDSQLGDLLGRGLGVSQNPPLLVVSGPGARAVYTFQ